MVIDAKSTPLFPLPAHMIEIAAHTSNLCLLPSPAISKIFARIAIPRSFVYNVLAKLALFFVYFVKEDVSVEGHSSGRRRDGERQEAFRKEGGVGTLGRGRWVSEKKDGETR